MNTTIAVPELPRSERVLFFLAAIVVAASCLRDEPEDPPYVRSPQGYLVYYVDQGTVASGRATMDQLYQWHADAVARGILDLNRAYGWPIEELQGMAYGLGWVLVDNCAFVASDGRTWAAGEFLPSSRNVKTDRIDVALYTWTSGPASTIPPDSPPWTRRIAPWDPNLARWGVLVAGNEWPATRHEMGHAHTQNAGFEHRSGKPAQVGGEVAF